MLVLSRKLNERIQIGNDIQVTILSVDRNRVKVGVTAPDHVRVTRSELLPISGIAGSLHRTQPSTSGLPDLQTSSRQPTANHGQYCECETCSQIQPKG